MDCQDLLETERVRTEILNVANSKRPAQDSVPVKEKGTEPVGRTKVLKDESAVSTKRRTVGKKGKKFGKSDQWRKAPGWRGVNQKVRGTRERRLEKGINSSEATPSTERRAV